VSELKVGTKVVQRLCGVNFAHEVVRVINEKRCIVRQIVENMGSSWANDNKRFLGDEEEISLRKDGKWYRKGESASRNCSYFWVNI